MTSTTFKGTAAVSAGDRQITAVPYRVVVGDGRLRLALEAVAGTVLDVPVERVRARPLGRAGATVVAVGESQMLVDFTRRARRASAWAGGPALRIVYGLSGRLTRHRFVRALQGRRR
jgi:hypothetical protein